MPGIETLRVMAAYTVLLQHAIGLTLSLNEGARSTLDSALGTAGGIAVNVFFVISGLLLGPGMLEGRPLGQFVRSRVLRLTPLYYLVGLYMVVLYAICLHDVPGRAALSHFTYTSIYNGLFLFGSSWTLCVEFTFIFLLPVVCRRLGHNDQRGLRTATILVLVDLAGHTAAWKAAGALPQDGREWLRVAPVSGLLPLLLGVAVGALLRSTDRRWIDRLQSHRALSTAVVVSIWCATVAAVPGFLQPITVSAGSAILVAATMGKSSALSPFGRYTYGVYLWHLPLLETVLFVMRGRFPNAYVPDMSWPAVVTVVVVVVMVSSTLAWLTYHVVEVPCMRLGRRGVDAGAQPG